MWNKIYPIALAVAVVVMCVLTYFAYSQLQSVGFAPSVIAGDYVTYEGYYQQFLWITTVILLILANILLWTNRKSWALWTTLGYFAFFVLLRGWWLNGVFLDYKQANSLVESNFSAAGLISTVICVIAAIGFFFDQFIVLRLHDRMYPVMESDISPVDKFSSKTGVEDDEF